MQVPFDEHGNLQSYPQRMIINGRVVESFWRDNYEFDDKLRIANISRGQSSAKFILKSDTDGREYPMFMKDMLELIQTSKISNGIVIAKWTFVKRGQNYGIKVVN